MRKPIDQYKAVFFDAGDTLLTIPAAGEIMHRFLDQRSYRFDRTYLSRLLDDTVRRFYYEHRTEQFAACTPESDRRFWTRIYTFLLKELGISEHAPKEQIEQWSHEMYNLYISPEYYALFDDVEETLRGLREKGLRLGVISNFAPTLRNILSDKGVLSYFDPVIVSTEVGMEKPNPAIFQLALKEAGLRADETLYVGDHEKNDIWAPRQIGIDAVRIKRYEYHRGDGMLSLTELLK